MTTSLADRFAALPSEARIRLLRRLVDAGRHTEIPRRVPRRDAGAVVRLSPTQEALWVYESLYPETSALNLACSYHFDGPVDPALLEEALTVVRDRHDVLRTRVVGGVGDLRVEFPPAGRFRLERVDLRGTGTSLAEALASFAHQPFDLRGEPLLRGALYTVDDRQSTLVLSLHHLVTDWWSFDVLHTEFVDVYQALRDGRPLPGGRGAIQYADFACWQRELEAAGVYDAQLRYWREYLAGLPAPLTVGTPRCADDERVSLYLTAPSPFHVSAATAARVREFALAAGATVYEVLMTAFAVLAHRLSGRDDFVIGTPVANRAGRGLEKLIGYVMNGLPTRWRIAPTDSFANLVKRFAAEFPAMLANADVPVGRIVGAVDPERWVGRSPLYQWVFMYLPQQESTRRLREIAEPVRVHTGGEHDIVGVLRDADDGLEGALYLRTDVYDERAVANWAAAFVVLLDGLLAAPDTPVGAVPLLTDADFARLSRSHAQPPAPASLADLVERQAMRTPDAVAVDAPGDTLTYMGLLARADRLAGALRARGAGPERLVALALGRGVDTVVAVLAVLRAGAAYLPIDPEYPPGRIRHLLADAAPALLVTDHAHAAALPDTGVPRIVLEDLACGVPPRAPVPTEPRRAAYVMYTSGTSGRPKGVVVTHAGIAGLAADLVARFGLDHTSRVLQHGSPSFDISVAEMCMAFGSGGTLVVPPPGPLAGAALADVLRRGRVTCTLMPPALLASLPDTDLPDLAVICSGGDVLPADLVAVWTADGTRRFHNGYGPTETTVGPTWSGPLTAADGVPPIGRPIAGVTTYLLDARLRPVPPGVPAELYVAGAGLARGYLGQPGTTSERFVADPFSPGGRMYRTGDLARWRDDGQLEFVGRADDQLSLHGVRAEPGEITAVLRDHPDVTDAAVLLRDGVLTAYLTPSAVDTEAVLRHALNELPAPLVPGVFVTLDALPVNAHGKLDRAALPAPDAVPVGGSAASPAEERLCALFAEALGVGPVARDADFFALGGDSIVAIQLVARAREAGLGLALRDIFALRTPARLAAAVDTAAAPVGSLDTDAGYGRFAPIPIMHWWHERTGDFAAFTMSALLRVPGGLDRPRLAAALQQLIDRHPALRLRLLRHSPTDWELEVPAPGPRRLEAVPVRADAAALTHAQIRTAAREVAARTRLAPENGRMLAATWYDNGPDEPGRLLLTVHHLAVDGVSWRLLHRDLTDLLAGRALAPLGTSFRSWSRLLHERARDTAEFDYWRRTLEAGTEARLAGERAVAGERATLTVTLPPERTEPLFHRVTAAFTCAPNDVLLTALLAAVVRWRGGGNGLLIDLEGHGRQAPDGMDLSGTVGWFTSQHPVLLETDAAGESYWTGAAAKALAQVAEQLTAVPNEGLGYGLLRQLNPDTARVLGALPEPDLRFNYLGRFAESAGDGVELLGVVPEGGLPLTHLIELDAVTRLAADGPHLVADWSYPTGSLTADEVARLAELWFAALDELAAAAAAAPLLDLPAHEIGALTAGLEEGQS
jgi:amino acid adenylation domain-containing protein/non-ribosomal peptide synthase protein (TIGR01720 family)